LNKKIKENEEKLDLEQQVNLDQTEELTRIKQSYQENLDNLEKVKNDAFDEIDFLKTTVAAMKLADETITGDISALRTYESELEGQIEGHELRIGTMTENFVNLEDSKKLLIDKTEKLKRDIDVINARMEEFESISNKGVDVLTDSFGVLIDSLGGAINTDSYDDTQGESALLPEENIYIPPVENFSASSTDYRRKREAAGQPVLIKQIYQLADFFRKMQQKNRDLKRTVEAISQSIPTLQTDIQGLNEKLTTSDEKILQNQRQLTKNLDAFNEHSSLIMDHDHDISKLQQVQLLNDQKFADVTNNTKYISNVEENFNEFETTAGENFRHVEGRVTGLQGEIKKVEEDVDTRFLLIDSGLRFFNDTVYREQQVKLKKNNKKFQKIVKKSTKNL